jgi:ASF1 like histone chaperone
LDLLPRKTLASSAPDTLLTIVRDEHDQELDSLLVGPIPVGVNKFIFEADPPDTNRIPDAEILGVTVILLTCAYDNREFVRVGYYVNNEYDSEELNADPPAKPILEKVRRNVLAEKPRVTRFAIKWYVLQTHIDESSANVQSTGTLRRLLHLNSHLSSLRRI